VRCRRRRNTQWAGGAWAGSGRGAAYCFRWGGVALLDVHRQLLVRVEPAPSSLLEHDLVLWEGWSTWGTWEPISDLRSEGNGHLVDEWISRGSPMLTAGIAHAGIHGAWE
jgi:hypothetical protein